MSDRVMRLGAVLDCLQGFVRHNEKADTEVKVDGKPLQSIEYHIIQDGNPGFINCKSKVHDDGRPLSVVPHKKWQEMRAKNLARAIKEYTDNNQYADSFSEWCDELVDLHKKMEVKGLQFTQELEEPITLHMALHILRNPAHWSENAIREVRLWAADKLEEGGV